MTSSAPPAPPPYTCIHFAAKQAMYSFVNELEAIVRRTGKTIDYLYFPFGSPWVMVVNSPHRYYPDEVIKRLEGNPQALAIFNIETT